MTQSRNEDAECEYQNKILFIDIWVIMYHHDSDQMKDDDGATWFNGKMY